MTLEHEEVETKGEAFVPNRKGRRMMAANNKPKRGSNFTKPKKKRNK